MPGNSTLVVDLVGVATQPVDEKARTNKIIGGSLSCPSQQRGTQAETSISDPSNVADVFSFLPLMWSPGATMSPFMGGVLSNLAIFSNPAQKWPDSLGKIALLRIYPYFLPCAVAARIAFTSFAFAFVGLRETLPSAFRRGRTMNGRAAEVDPLLPVENAAEDPVDVVLPLGELLTRPVSIALLNHGLLSFCLRHTIAFGGLGLKPYDIGLIMGICRISNAAVQVILGGRVIRYFGPRRVFIAAFCALTFVFGLYPLLSTLGQRANRVDAAVLAVLVCQLSCSVLIYFAFAATMLVITDSTPNCGSVGSVTGLSQMVATVMCSATPSIASSLFALSTKHNLLSGYFVYVVLRLVGIRFGAALLAAASPTVAFRAEEFVLSLFVAGLWYERKPVCGAIHPF
ncbi:hypothetical protein B0H19DRAFT_1258409 [Mycena capillaripes]|nr:hypothetical protein B0H19DRAFT_1258409 [Mycena capillaripes]